MTGDARFQVAGAYLLKHEKGLADDPDDPGGITNWGWSLRTLETLTDVDDDGWMIGDLDRDGDIDGEDIRLMTPATALGLYFDQFWQRYRYGDLELMVAKYALDFSVHMGPGAAHRVLQRAVRAASELVLQEDGILGPATRAALQAAPKAPLTAAIRSEAAGRYRYLVGLDPPGRGKYLRGWLNRAYDR